MCLILFHLASDVIDIQRGMGGYVLGVCMCVCVCVCGGGVDRGARW